jgi:5-methylcytosine-specific restriction endonuclease McrA
MNSEGMLEIVSRPEARRLGMRHYFTGKPCPQGHIAKRYICNGKCVKCHFDEHKRYVERNRDRLTAQDRLYREANAGIIKPRQRDYARTSPVRRAYKHSPQGRLIAVVGRHRRRARERLAPGSHTSADVKKLIERCTRCYLCGKRFNKARRPTLDHVLAIATKLATNEFANLALACDSCNKRKSARRENPITGQGLLL